MEKINLEQAKKEHKEAQRELDNALGEMVKPNNIKINFNKGDESLELPSNEIAINKSSGIIAIRSNSESLQVIEKTVLNLNKAGLFTNSCPNYIQ